VVRTDSQPPGSHVVARRALSNPSHSPSDPTPDAAEGPAVRLLQRVIDALEPRAARYVAWDTEVRGFGVRVSPSDVKTYILKYRTKAGRVRWATLGRVGDLPLEKARDRARSWRGQVAEGLDPLRTLDRARDGLSVGAVADRFLEEHVEVRLKPTTQRDYRQVIDAQLRPQLGTLPIAELTTDDVLRLQHRLGATPPQANRVLAVLSSLVSWAMRAKLCPVGANPCVGVKRYREGRRRRYLDAGEYARVGRALRDAKKKETIAPGPLAAIELVLLTGARPREILTLEWSHVDLAEAVLRLPDSKTGEKTIYLSPAAVRLLKRWPRWASSDYVFPGTGRRVKGAHMHGTTVVHAWAALRKAAGLEDVRLYDAGRHSFASIGLTHHQLSLAQIGEQLGHSQPATTARYAHLHDDIAKRNARAIGGTIARALARRQP